jgi:HCOMODA/2-hydroxy-3-carboxy-muconic semialdehyde decarboxylase
MTSIGRIKRDLVIANRILAYKDVLDTSGHVSHRHPHDPKRFLMSRSLSPALVTLDDILELSLDCIPSHGDQRPLSVERFIHGAIYEARPDVLSVVHSHSDEVLPFTISSVPMRAVAHGASDVGTEVPLWEISDKFGDQTRLVVTNMTQGRDLAAKLGSGNLVLMRGHGYAAASRSIVLVVQMCLELPRNAQAQLLAMQLGVIKPLSAGEVAARESSDPNSSSIRRGWEAYARKAGVGELLMD